MKIKVQKKPQEFKNLDYEYKFNNESKLVEEIEIGGLQEKINSCNYCSLDKLYDKFLETGSFDLSNATSKGLYHRNKLDDIIESENKILSYADELGIEITDEDSLDDIIEMIYKMSNNTCNTVQDVVENEKIESEVINNEKKEN